MVGDPSGAPVRSYLPGEWFGIVGERAVVILPPTEKPRVAALWELVDGGAGFDVTLDALISGGLRELSAFVLVSTGEGETRVVIRGPARAEFQVGGETVQLEGSNATTWVERSMVEVERMSIVLHDDEPDDDLPSYVVDGGLFRISRLDEAPAHEGPDELAEEPAYEHEFPLYADDPLGMGSALLDYAEQFALSRGVRTLYLLTTTAEGFFVRRGYSTAARENAPPAIRSTREFAGICPASSAFMSKQLHTGH